MTLDKLLNKVVLLSGLSLFSYNCASTSPDSTYCSKDTDCKGERICDQNTKMCVDGKGSNNSSCYLKETNGCEDFTGCYYPTPDAIKAGWDDEPLCFETLSNCRSYIYSFTSNMKPNCNLSCTNFDKYGIMKGNYIIDKRENQGYILCDDNLYVTKKEGMPNFDLNQSYHFKKTEKTIEPNNCCQ